MIISAPWVFALALATLGTAIWFFLTWLKAAEVNGLREQVRLKDFQIAHKDSLLRDMRPLGTAFELRSNTALKSDTMNAVSELRAFYQREVAKENDVNRNDRVLEAQVREENPGGMGHFTRMQQEQKQIRDQAWKHTYESQFRTRVIMLRDEICARLSSIPPGGIWGPGSIYVIPDHALFDNPGHLLGIQTVASNLEKLAALLPRSTQ